MHFILFAKFKYGRELEGTFIKKVKLVHMQTLPQVHFHVQLESAYIQGTNQPFPETSMFLMFKATSSPEIGLKTDPVTYSKTSHAFLPFLLWTEAECQTPIKANHFCHLLSGNFFQTMFF